MKFNNSTIFKRGDIFEENVTAIVNPVNCVGVMGKGLALEFKKRFPANYQAYQEACSNSLVVLGRVYIFKTNSIHGLKYILNFPTKHHWKDRSRIKDIENGLNDLMGVLLEFEIGSVAIPALGCGLGGLDWKDVSKLIEETFSDVNKKIIVFEPC